MKKAELEIKSIGLYGWLLVDRRAGSKKYKAYQYRTKREAVSALKRATYGIKISKEL